MCASRLDEFKSRLREHWLLPFCRAKGYGDAGFDTNSVERLCESDAADFIYALDHGLVAQHGWYFLAAQSKAKEQIFWQGAKTSDPREITLWHEPIITMAAVARLARDFSWPKAQIGMQSKTWAFDLVAYDQSHELLVCEVKKSQKEVDQLVELIDKHRKTPAEKVGELEGAERNALKKVCALRDGSAPVFWALGPNRHQHIFKIDRTGELKLLRADEPALRNPTA